MKFVCVVALLFSAVSAQTEKFPCSKAGAVKASGSTTVAPVTAAIGAQYVKKCGSTYTVSVEATGSSDGANRVCAVGSAVDIGNMSRDWRTTEVTKLADGTSYQCIIGDKTRVVHRVQVAIDGVVVFFEKSGNLAGPCVQALGGSLSSAQLRWVYSNLTTVETTAIPNKDGSAATRKWSELSATCPDAEIVIAAPGPTFGTHDFFKEVIFTEGSKETFRAAVKYEADNSIPLLNLVLNNDNSVGFFGYGYFTEQLSITAFAIDGVAPTDITLGGSTYFPLGRRIYSNFWAGALDKTKCIADLHFSSFGASVIDTTGFLPIPAGEYAGQKSVTPGKCCNACGFFRRIFGLCGPVEYRC